MIKAIVDFSSHTDGDLGPTAQGVHDVMGANAATYATPSPTLAVLQTRIGNYTTALGNSLGAPSQANTLEKNTARKALEDGLSLLGGYVNSVAQGDPAEVQTTTGDPGVEAGWAHAATFTSGSGTLSGLAPGALVWVRVRSIGPGGTSGAWCDPSQIRVL